MGCIKIFNGIIFGSGLQKDISLRFPKASTSAVRGALTRDRIGAPKTTFLGDPGILAPRLVDQNTQKKYNRPGAALYIINETVIRRWKNQYPSEIKIIDVQRKPHKVISEIASCQHIISSSLHGLITADALGISNAWMQLRAGAWAVILNSRITHDLSGGNIYQYR